VHFTSGLHGLGIDELFPLVRKVHEQYHRRVPTAAWNQALADAVAFRPPPTARGKRLKFNYITQFGIAPPTLAIFVNQPDFFRDQYKRYLEKFFRERFGFEGAPLVFQVRRRRAKKGSTVP
jgi:GTP-binding protein